MPGEIARPDVTNGRSERARQAIAQARRILEEEGPAALTMRRLAEELGIRAPSLYKHFSSKGDLELALIEDAMAELGELNHRALHERRSMTPLESLLVSYRRFCVAHGNLYRLATGGKLEREKMTPGLEKWAGNPWFVVTGDASVAQALWSYAHGMVILELDERYPPGSDLDLTWRAGAAAFEQVTRSGPGHVRPARPEASSRSARR